jgi:hypothetical protein
LSKPLDPNAIDGTHIFGIGPMPETTGMLNVGGRMVMSVLTEAAPGAGLRKEPKPAPAPTLEVKPEPTPVVEHPSLPVKIALDVDELKNMLMQYGHRTCIWHVTKSLAPGVGWLFHGSRERPVVLVNIDTWTEAWISYLAWIEPMGISDESATLFGDSLDDDPQIGPMMAFV